MRSLGMLALFTATAGCAALAGAAGAQTRGCHAAVVDGVLPTWARGGFSDPAPRMPYVLGSSRKIAGILFGNPLQSPAPTDHNNKILWVSRLPTSGPSDLRISAQRMNGTQRIGAAVGRSVSGGPGPSIIDLPSAGCWRLTLRWSGRHDTLDLRYAVRR